MKFWIYIAILTVLGAGCTKDVATNENLFVVEGTLFEGSNVRTISVLEYLQEASDNSAFAPSDRAEVWLNWNNTRWDFVLSEDGEYVNDDPMLQIFPDQTYQLVVVQGEDTATAQTIVPPAINYTPQNAGTIAVDTLSASSIVLQIEWNSVDGYLMVLGLEELDIGDEIPFTAVTGGLFDFSFSNPIANDQANIFDNDFLHVGAHRINLYRISSQADSIYTFVPDPLSTNVFDIEDNVIGGAGFFNSVATGSVLVNIEVE